jgi:hypothetical protein
MSLSRGFWSTIGGHLADMVTAVLFIAGLGVLALVLAFL